MYFTFVLQKTMQSELAGGRHSICLRVSQEGGGWSTKFTCCTLLLCYKRRCSEGGWVGGQHSIWLRPTILLVVGGWLVNSNHTIQPFYLTRFIETSSSVSFPLGFLNVFLVFRHCALEYDNTFYWNVLISLFPTWFFYVFLFLDTVPLSMRTRFVCNSTSLSTSTSLQQISVLSKWPAYQHTCHLSLRLHQLKL